jgi:superfamily II DNA or RNA helicase
MVLSEGFDCPELKTVFCRPSGKGVTIQMGGRVLRKHPELSFKQIVQCQKTRWPFLRTAAAVMQYTWSGSNWRSLQVNPLISQINSRMLRTLAQTETQLPPWLVKRQPRQRRRERWAHQSEE